MSKWMEIAVEVPDEVVDALQEIMGRFASGGAVVEKIIPEEELLGLEPAKAIVKVYIPWNRQGLLRKKRLEEALWHFSAIVPIPVPSVRYWEEGEWLEAWKKFYTVLHIGKRLVVKPSWECYVPGPEEVMVELDPGLAFGTGLHPSTRLCLLAMEQILKPGERVLDVGTGSGILALFAAKLGAKEVLALDIDRVAVKVARENVFRNGLRGKIKVRWGSLIPTGEAPLIDASALKPFGLILANITAPVIRSMAKELSIALAPEGFLVVSGIIQPQKEETLEALSSQGLQCEEELSCQEWVALILRKSHP
ncbi:MAG: 50S ribosomal protein L11 methyltransferase [Anaerolineae bacterium]|nr:50S ribosomal protein L11 methyltransferase [Anaerolineae bacterium]